jgi:hypothetical protein
VLDDLSINISYWSSANARSPTKARFFSGSADEYHVVRFVCINRSSSKNTLSAFIQWFSQNEMLLDVEVTFLKLLFLVLKLFQLCVLLLQFFLNFVWRRKADIYFLFLFRIVLLLSDIFQNLIFLKLNETFSFITLRTGTNWFSIYFF